MRTQPSRWADTLAKLAALVCFGVTCAVGCDRSSNAGPSGASLKAVAKAEAAPIAAAPPSRHSRVTPARLLSTNGSAYAATLAATEDWSYLLTASAAYRFVPGEAPERWLGNFGDSPAVTPGQIVFWSEGAMRQVPASGGAATLVARVLRQPQRIVSSGDHISWLSQAPDGRFSIHTLDGSKARLVHAANGYVGTLAMNDEHIYFAERAPDRSWRLGVVPRSGGTAHYTRTKRGRLPAMLVVTESLYYYDGPSSSVLRLSPDLASEQVLARGVICSPMAVAENVYCAQPAGLLEIGSDGEVRRTFPLEESGGTITAVAATTTRLLWVTDAGGGRFAVDSVPLS